MISFGRLKLDDDMTGMFIHGHANYAKEGEDIVCAAVSGIGCSAAQGCQIYDTNTQIRHCEKGNIEFVCKKTAETEAIARTALAGLFSIKEQYPQCFNMKKD